MKIDIVKNKEEVTFKRGDLLLMRASTYLIVEEYDAVMGGKERYSFVNIENGFIPDAYRKLSKNEVNKIIKNSVVKTIPEEKLVIKEIQENKINI